LVEIIGFPRPAGTRHGKDGALFAEVERERFSGCQRGEHRFAEPFGNNLEELISIHKLFTYVNKNSLNCLLCQTNFEGMGLGILLLAGRPFWGSLPLWPGNREFTSGAI